MKSVKLEWCLGDIQEAKVLLEESVKHYSDFSKVGLSVCISISAMYPSSTCISKSPVSIVPFYINFECCIFQLWMMKGQIEEQGGQFGAARDAYNQGVSKLI